jgi:hypothetical protein
MPPAGDLLPTLAALSLASAVLALVLLARGGPARRDLRRMHGAGALLGGIALLLAALHGG